MLRCLDCAENTFRLYTVVELNGEITPSGNAEVDELVPGKIEAAVSEFLEQDEFSMECGGCTNLKTFVRKEHKSGNVLSQV